VVTKKDFGKDLLFIRLEIYTRHIKEIMVTNSDDITAESLGLVPKGQKKYTPAERRVKTAGDFDGQFGLNTAFSIDPLLNALSGRTKQLKAELEVERKEFIQQKINSNFDAEFMMNKLHIPEEYVEGFVFYLVEDSELKEAIKAKNKTLATFRMSALAVEYLQLKNVQPYYPKVMEPEKTKEIEPEIPLSNPETKKDE
jgi:hypothetical protein